jgi:hypothetical protein
VGQFPRLLAARLLGTLKPLQMDGHALRIINLPDIPLLPLRGDPELAQLAQYPRRGRACLLFALKRGRLRACPRLARRQMPPIAPVQLRVACCQESPFPSSLRVGHQPCSLHSLFDTLFVWSARCINLLYGRLHACGA